MFKLQNQCTNTIINLQFKGLCLQGLRLWGSAGGGFDTQEKQFLLHQRGDMEAFVEGKKGDSFDSSGGSGGLVAAGGGGGVRVDAAVQRGLEAGGGRGGGGGGGGGAAGSLREHVKKLEENDQDA